MDTLVIGLNQYEIKLDNNHTFFSGCRHETLPWEDLTIHRSVGPHKFSTIIICDPSLFFTLGGEFDHRKCNAILSTLSQDGEIHLIYNDVSKPLFTLFKTKYKYQPLVAENPHSFREYTLLTGRYVEHSSIPIPFQVLRQKPVESQPPIEIKTRSLRKYTTVEIDLKSNQVTGITINLFRQELDDEEFVKKFTQSIRELLKVKLHFYRQKLKEVRKDFARVKRKTESLSISGVSTSAIKEMFPMKDFYAGFILELEEMIEKIHSKINIEWRKVRENLIDALDDSERGIASIVGRDNIKNSLVNQLYAFSQSYRTFVNAFNNICLVGPAGCGKTLIAKVIGYVFSKSGILVTDQVRIVSRADLVGSYVGQTAPRVRGTLLESLEGVLFIDEAYQLAPGDSKQDYGHEAITEIVNFIDKYIGMITIIVAGYEDRMMERFFPANEGLARRFPYLLILEKYTTEELTEILIQFIEKKTELLIDEETGNYLYSIIVYLETLTTNEVGGFEASDEQSVVFPNQAGDMLNLGTFLVKAINSSYTIKWRPKDLENNKPILAEGVRDYLGMKGLML